MNIKHKKGIFSQLIAQSYFAKKTNKIVFTPVGGIGPVDMVVFDTKTKEYINYDVKSVSFRKNRSYGCKEGTRINRSPSKKQKDLQVKILYVYENGRVEIQN